MVLGIIYIKQARKLLVQLFASEQSDSYESVLLANMLSNTAKNTRQSKYSINEAVYMRQKK